MASIPSFPGKCRFLVLFPVVALLMLSAMPFSIMQSATAQSSEASSIGTLNSDFNGDGYDDLAVGAPLEDAAAFNSGDVTVFFGSVSGLQSSVMLIQVGDLPEQNEQFGRALAVGDFDGDIDCILRLKE